MNTVFGEGDNFERLNDNINDVNDLITISSQSVNDSEDSDAGEVDIKGKHKH